MSINFQQPVWPWFISDPQPEKYLEAPYLVLDLETTNIQKGWARENTVVCAAWYCSWDDSRVVRYDHVDDDPMFERLMADIEHCLDNEGFLVGHNIKFDLQHLSYLGLDLRQVWCWDTMVADYCFAGNRKWKFDLNSTASRYRVPQAKTPLTDNLMKGGVCPSTFPKSLLRARVVRDVKATNLVFQEQVKRAKKQAQLPLVYTRNLLTPCLAAMELEGIGLVPEAVKGEYQKQINQRDAYYIKWRKRYGDINPKSTKQMIELVYDTLGFEELTQRGKPIRTASGKPKVDATTISKLKCKTDEQREFVDLRQKIIKTESLLSKNLEYFKAICDEKGGVFYGVFNQTVTQTHRLSSQGRGTELEFFGGKSKGIQLQNMPRMYKPLVGPKNPDTHYISEIDGAQLEFRVAAFLGQDERAVEGIIGGEDRHLTTALYLNNMQLGDWEKLPKVKQGILRTAAKAETFKPLYGGRYGTEEQMRYYEGFRDLYPGIAETQKGWTYNVLQNHGKLRTITGLELFFPGTEMKSDGYVTNTPNIYNYPIQSLATADIIPIGVVYLWHRLNGTTHRVVNTVHDSAVVEVDRGNVFQYMYHAERAFTLDVYRYLEQVYQITFNVPLGVECKVGEYWSDDSVRSVVLDVDIDGWGWTPGNRCDAKKLDEDYDVVTAL